MSFPDFFKSRRFLPLFTTQFFGAFNDNFFKTALTVLIVYSLATTKEEGQILASVGTGLFILPYILFSSLAGQLADKFEKRFQFCTIKGCEIAIMAAGSWALIEGNIEALLIVLFLMGMHSTFFSPLKYSILPDHLRDKELLAGNATLEAGTFIAILAGMLAGSQLVRMANGPEIVSILLLAIASAGFASSFFIPRTPAPSPDLVLSFNPLTQTRELLRQAASNHSIWLIILGVSWFWLVGAVTLSQIPALAKNVLNADQGVLSVFLALFSIGIGVGSVLCSRILKGEISARIVPFGALGMAVAGGDLFVAIFFHRPDAFLSSETLVGFTTFIADPFGWRIMADLFLFAIFGGFFVVPLNTMLQARSEPARRARIIAANNIVNAIFMVAGSVIAAGIIAAGGGLSMVFLALALGNLLAAIIICQILPESTLKYLLSSIIKRLFRVQLQGFENLSFDPPEPGQPGKVFIANHVSFLDAAFIVLFSPARMTFAIDTLMAQKWWVRPFLNLVDTVAVDPTNPLSIKHLVRLTQSGKNCMIFPEGRLTQTGGLMKIYDGPAMVADRANAEIVMIYINGLQFTPYTRLNGKLPVHWFPQTTLTAYPPKKLVIDPKFMGKRRRQEASRALYVEMSNAIFRSSENLEASLWRTLLKAASTYGEKRPILEDIERKPISYARLIQGSVVLGRKFAQFTETKETVGVLLPSSVGFAVTFFALQAIGRLPAILNFSTGAANMVRACQTTNVKTVLTSRRFIEKGKMQPVIDALENNAGIKVVYLEDVRARINLADKIAGLFARRIAKSLPQPGVGDPAVILFTSGSEGTPKGVVLSHRNIIANCNQLHAHVDFTTADSVFNPLPVFHSLGLTGGLLLLTFYGVKTFLYPSPLHYKIVSELVYDTASTVLFSTDTFLAGYARVANPYDFRSLRFIIAGAERIKEETRRVWSDRFGVRILEGYGATEASPVIAVNNNLYFKAGTVGLMLPGVESRLDPVEGVKEGGRLFIRGPNILLGYIKDDAPGIIQTATSPDGWYDTGDIVIISEDGFVSIAGRLKRFAKIGGEMISLPAIEDAMTALWPGERHAIVAVPDAKKGEQLIALTTKEDGDRADLSAHIRKNGFSELSVPKTLKTVAAIPLLGNGKIDYPACLELAKDLTS